MSHDFSHLSRRRIVGAGLGAAGLSALPLSSAIAQTGEIVVGAAPPITGVFAFAGVGLHRVGAGDDVASRDPDRGLDHRGAADAALAHRRLPRRVMPPVLGADPPVEAPAGPVELHRSGAVDPPDDPRVEGPERAPLTLGDRVAVTGGPVHAPRTDPDVGRIENGLVRGGSHRGRRLGPRTRRPEGHDRRR